VAEKVINIGGASGAWGDSPMAIPQLLTADVHYLMMDYLAEVTMSLLARARMKDANAGFPPDFVAYLKRSLPEIAKRRIKVVSNGGAVNPQGAKRALEALCAELGLSLKIAVVEGDDVMPRIDALRATVREVSTGEPLPPKLLTANAYLGALPIAAALDRGADIVITGRCADSALALGILIHEFGWRADDYDSSLPAAWSATSSNAGRNPPAACIPTGTRCRAGRISAIRSPPAKSTAASCSGSPTIPAG
jgi:hypothetical protein